MIGQLRELLTKTRDPDARMATIVAALHHKFDSFFWTGFYFLKEGELVVPVTDQNGSILGVLDVDSTTLSSFDEVDAENLEEIVGMIYT